MSTAASNHKKSVIAFSGMGILLVTICVCSIVLMVYGYNKRQATRKEELSNLIGSEETNFHTYQGYFIPVTDENVNVLMQRINAKKSERSFVIARMQEWARLQIPTTIDPPIITVPGGSSSSNCSYCWDAWKSCHSICRMCMQDQCDTTQCSSECDADLNSCQSSCQ